jgi:hypothetical protein
MDGRLLGGAGERDLSALRFAGALRCRSYAARPFARQVAHILYAPSTTGRLHSARLHSRGVSELELAAGAGAGVGAATDSLTLLASVNGFFLSLRARRFEMSLRSMAGTSTEGAMTKRS